MIDSNWFGKQCGGFMVSNKNIEALKYYVKVSILMVLFTSYPRIEIDVSEIKVAKVKLQELVRASGKKCLG